MARRLPFSVKQAEATLRAADPVLARLIEAHGPFLPRPGSDPYSALVRTILFQQLAGAAARAIDRKWRALYSDDGRTPAPSEILETSDEQFRSAGVSRQKASYLRDLALHVADGRLDFAKIGRLQDTEVVQRLTDVHGLGEWSAHMFLMFELGRPDVLPTGDMGMRNGMRLAYGLNAMPTPAEAREIGAPWAPFRTVGSWYMWRAAETVTPVS
ncbi:MAG: DNA-3-methyladenine glycosylase [Dehalococcoidia bacterium]